MSAKYFRIQLLLIVAMLQTTILAHQREEVKPSVLIMESILLGFSVPDNMTDGCAAEFLTECSTQMNTCIRACECLGSVVLDLSEHAEPLSKCRGIYTYDPKYNALRSITEFTQEKFKSYKCPEEPPEAKIIRADLDGSEKFFILGPGVVKIFCVMNFILCFLI